ncbi:hypothetical protein [Bradyrhizobium sp. NAS80.1]|uniref:hypothetical protein n=1 Tax=Bradyrhizobium sp. NAS80.1 TaxID=1680159 RepID=UPI000A05DE31|nr:hypothetical protein [Bradyrhizobium sp. NAS80.1]
MTKPRIPQQNPLAVVDEQARNASPFQEKWTPGFDEPRLIPQNAAASTMLDLGRSLVIDSETAYLLGLVTPEVDHGHTFDVPHVTVPAADTVELDPMAILRANSSVVRAGARILVAQVAPAEVRDGIQVMFHQDALLRSVDPAPFALVADGADATTSPHPTHDALFNWTNCPSYAFRTKITRADRRSIGGDGLRAAIMIGVLKGLGELADNLVLQAILAATPAAFSLGAASARFAKFDELRALVGAAGTGAVVGQDGVLRANGIMAELTAAATQTVIGRFTRTAVAIRPELAVHAHRINNNGDTEISVFCNAQAVVSTPTDFWVAA